MVRNDASTRLGNSEGTVPPGATGQEWWGGGITDQEWRGRV